jgi:serine/threonine protein kinase
MIAARYYGPFGTDQNTKEGLLLEEANHGDLQSYIDRKDVNISNALRREWSFQLATAVAYVHSKGIIHSNLSTTNVLVHQAGQTTRLILADFGGSQCRELNLNGGLVPDTPFRAPQSTEFDSPKMDVFSLGVMMYIIATGHYPFHQGPAPQGEERYAYEHRVQEQLDQGEFPDLSDVQFGEIIAGCCLEGQFATAGEVLKALEAEMR